MKLHELFARHAGHFIIEQLIVEYPDQITSWEGYVSALEELHGLTLSESKCDLLVHRVEDDETLPASVRCDPYICVSGVSREPNIKDGDLPAGTYYAIEFDPWEEWLGMEVLPESFDGRSELSVLAHVLWEMTFCGYSNKAVAIAREGLNDRVDDYENSKKE